MNVSDIISRVQSAHDMAKLIEAPFDAKYVAYWCEVSLRHAERMLQCWEGDQIAKRKIAQRF